MALSLRCSSHLHPPQPSYSSDRSKVSVGLRLQSPNNFGFTKPNLEVEFYKKVHKNIQPRTDSKPIRGRIVMMPFGVPVVIIDKENDVRLDLWNAFYQERIIFIGESIDENYSNQLLCTMLYLDCIEPKKLTMYLNCPGGDITPTMALYDTMQSLRNPVTTSAMGYALDWSVLLLAGGQKGQRSSMPRTNMILQPPVGAARGQADNVLRESIELLRIRDHLYKEFAKHTCQPLEKIHEDLKWFKHFSPPEAKEYGIIDKIIRPARLTDIPSSKRRAWS